MAVSVQLGNHHADDVKKKQSKEEEMTTTRASSGYASIIVDAAASTSSSFHPPSSYKDRLFPPPSEEAGETTRLLFPSQKQEEEESLPFRRGWCFVAAALISSVGLFGYVLSVKTSHYYYQYASSSSTDQCYSYIVVGAGPSGILAATKLANAFPSLQVLLLEAGTTSQAQVQHNLVVQRQMHQHTKKHASSYELQQQQDDPLFHQHFNSYDIPLLWSSVATSPQNSNWKVLPEHSTFLGKAVGGSGVHNAMIHLHALASDIEQWNFNSSSSTEHLWSYEILQQHFQSLETYYYQPEEEGNNSTTTSSYDRRGTNGPLPAVSAGSLPLDPIGPLFVQAASKIVGAVNGFNFNRGNGKSRLGAGYYEFNIWNGRRQSVAQALLGGANHKVIPPNLEIRTGAVVSKIHLHEPQQHPTTSSDTTTRRVLAKGVKYYDTTTSSSSQEQESTDGDDTLHHHHRHRHQNSNKKHQHVYLTPKDPHAAVILAAGAILTPHLLQNSLDQNDIRLDHPVENEIGANLQDHPVVAMAFEWNITAAGMLDSTSLYSLGANLQAYYASMLAQTNTTMTSPLGTAGFSAGAFLKSPYPTTQDSDTTTPDLQLTVFPRSLEPHVMMQSTKQNASSSIPSETTMVITIALLHPEVRYKVVHSNDSNDSNNNHSTSRLPTIQGLEHLTDRDVQRLEWGIHQVRHMVQQSPLSEVLAKEVVPGASVVDGNLHTYIRQHHLPNSHWVGSCAMGRVVNERLQVMGVDRLRIIDASVIPKLPSGNPHATVCAVASRGAELMMQERQQAEANRAQEEKDATLNFCR